MQEQDNSLEYHDLLVKSGQVHEVMTFLRRSKCTTGFFSNNKHRSDNGYECTIVGLYMPKGLSGRSHSVWFSSFGLYSGFTQLLRLVEKIENSGLVYHEVYSEKLGDKLFAGRYAIRAGKNLLVSLNDVGRHNEIAAAILSEPELGNDKKSVIGNDKWPNDLKFIPFSFCKLTCVEENVRKAIDLLIDSKNVRPDYGQKLRKLSQKLGGLPTDLNYFDKYYWPENSREQIMPYSKE